jgi:hypothetical protein
VRETSFTREKKRREKRKGKCKNHFHQKRKKKENRNVNLPEERLYFTQFFASEIQPMRRVAK